MIAGGSTVDLVGVAGHRVAARRCGPGRAGYRRPPRAPRTARWCRTRSHSCGRRRRAPCHVHLVRAASRAAAGQSRRTVITYICPTHCDHRSRCAGQRRTGASCGGPGKGRHRVQPIADAGVGVRRARILARPERNPWRSVIYSGWSRRRSLWSLCSRRVPRQLRRACSCGSPDRPAVATAQPDRPRPSAPCVAGTGPDSPSAPSLNPNRRSARMCRRAGERLDAPVAHRPASMSL
jgi:hypothetical protein